MTETSADLTVLGAVEEVKQNAGNLDLQWKLRPATVIGSDDNTVSVVFDGDSKAIPILSLVGNLSAGDRVYVIQIPPSGNYAVGFASGVTLSSATSFDQFAAVQLKNDGSFANVLQLSGSAATKSFTKQRSGSRIAYVVTADCFASATGGVVDFGLNIDGSDYSVTSYFFNAGSDHRQINGPGIIDDSANPIPAGVYDVTLRWRKVSGAQINMDNNSRLMFLLWEVAPEVG